MKKLLVATFVAGSMLSASAQHTTVIQGGPPQEGGARPMGGGMMMANPKNTTLGTITAIDGASITVKSVYGKSVSVKTNEETRFNASGMGGMMVMRQGPDGRTTTEGGQPNAQGSTPAPNGKISDFKVGDPVLIRHEGEGELVARMVGKVPPMAIEAAERQAAEMGKTIVAGEIKAIDETKLTIARVDGVTSTIEVDENTSFFRGRENITLSDFKVGDNIMARGEVKNNVFVAKELRTGGMMRMQRTEPGAAPANRM